MSSREQIINTALSGEELKTVLREGFEKLLKAEGMLASNGAFGRVGYTLALRLHLNNPFFPVSTTRVESTASAGPNYPLGRPIDLRAEPGTSTHDTVFHRDVVSPNAERLALGLPVPAVAQQQDGSTKSITISYPVPAEDPRTDPGHIVTEEEAREKGYNIIEPDGQG